MKLIHIKDPATNYCPMYSVEYRRKRPGTEAWSQHVLTHSKWSARLQYIECWLRNARAHTLRIRVL